jgi:hypothetical protein
MKKPPAVNEASLVELPAIRALLAHGYAFIPPSLHPSLRDGDNQA